MPIPQRLLASTEHKQQLRYHWFTSVWLHWSWHRIWYTTLSNHSYSKYNPSGTGARVQPRGVTTCNTPLPLHRVPVSTQHLCMVFFICSIVFSLEKNDSKTLINPQALKDLNYCYIHASHIMSNIGPQFKISNEKKKILTNACEVMIHKHWRKINCK